MALIVLVSLALVLLPYNFCRVITMAGRGEGEPCCEIPYLACNTTKGGQGLVVL